MIAQAIELLVRMARDPDMPTSGRIGKAINAIMYRTLARSRGSLRAGARAMNVAHSTFAHQIAQGLADVCEYMAMHETMDNTLWPFVRVAWAGNDVSFVHDYITWMTDVVQPQAHAESTPYVLLHNFSAFDGVPSAPFVQTLVSEVGAKTDLSVLRGVVVYGPDNVTSALVPVNESKGVEHANAIVRSASDPQVALDLVAQLFSAEGITLPELHLD